MIEQLLLLINLNQDPDSMHFHFDSAKQLITGIRIEDASLVVDYNLFGDKNSDIKAYFHIERRDSLFSINPYAHKLVMKLENNKTAIYEDTNANTSLDKKTIE